MELGKTASRRIAIIANGRAGDGNAIKKTLSARTNLWGRDCDYFFPTSLSELRTTCFQITPTHYDALVVIGGDGTVNQVIRNLHAHPNPVPLYPFAGGTANDLARELSLNPDWNQVQTLVDQKRIDWIDLVEVNGVPFATVAGLGIGSTLAHEFNTFRDRSVLFREASRLFRAQIYTLLSANFILFRTNYTHHLNIQAPGFQERLKTPAVFICNQTYFGGDLKVAPRIDNNDRRFNVLIVNTSSKYRLLKSMMQLKQGHLPPNFYIFSTDQLTITDLDEKPISAFGDGETLISSPRLEIRLSPKKLAVFRSEVIH